MTQPPAPSPVERLPSILLALLFAWMPLVFFVRAADGFTLTKEVVAALGVAGLGVFALDGGARLLRFVLVQAVLGFTLWMVLDSLAVGELKMEAVKGSVHILLMAGAFLAVVSACSRGISYEKLIHGALLAGGLMALYGLFQTVGWDRLHWNTHFESRAFSTLGNPDYLGGHLAVLLPLAFILTLRSPALSKTWLWYRGVTLVLFVGLLTTRVRGSFLALGGAALFLGVAFFTSWGRPLFNRSRRFVLLTLGVLLVGVIAFLARHGGLEAFSVHQFSVRQRVEIYKVAWEMVKDHPWLGIGLGQVGVQFPAYQARPFSPGDFAQHPYTYSEHIHNEFLQFWVEGGLPGLLLFLAVLLAFVLAVARFLRNPETKARDKEIMIGVAGGVTALLLQSLSNFPLQLAPTTVLFGLLLAAPLALRPAPPVPFSLSGGRRVLLALVGLAVLGLGARALAASIAFRDTVGETSLGHSPLAVYYGGRLVGLSPRNPKAWNAYAGALESGGQAEQAFQAYGKSLGLNPQYVESLLAMAKIRLSQGNFGETLDLCRKAEAVTPNYAAPLWPMAISLFELQRYGEAAKAFEQFSTYSPNDFQAYLNLGVCYIKLKRKAEAVAAWKRAYALNPADPQVAQYLKANGGL